MMNGVINLEIRLSLLRLHEIEYYGNEDDKGDDKEERASE